MNSKYIVPLGCALGGGLIYRHFYDMYLDNVNYKNEGKIYALVRYQHYDNIFNVGAVCGLGLGLIYVSFKDFNFPFFKISPNFS